MNNIALACFCVWILQFETSSQQKVLHPIPSVRTCKIYGNVMDGQGFIMGGIMKKETLRDIYS